MSLECDRVTILKKNCPKRFNQSKFVGIHFVLRRENLQNFQFGHDHQIFSLMRSIIKMEFKEANHYG